MNNYPSKLLENAVDAISSLPGVGRRSALRLALHLLKQPQEKVRYLASSLTALRDEVLYCKVCWMISDNDLCSICSDTKRDKSQICVVESVRDVMSIENTGQYHGTYHVLGGIISPIDGVGPSDLTIAQLVERVRGFGGSGSVGEVGGSESAGEDGGGFADSESEVEVGVFSGSESKVEVIFALSGDVEGETTAFYIYRQLEGLNVKVSTIARGLGFGDDLEYADELTLGRSIVNRHEFRPNNG